MKKEFSIKISADIKLVTREEQTHIKGGGACSCTEEKRRTVRIRR